MIKKLVIPTERLQNIETFDSKVMSPISFWKVVWLYEKLIESYNQCQDQFIK